MLLPFVIYDSLGLWWLPSTCHLEQHSSNCPCCGGRGLPSAPDLLWGDQACEQTKVEPSGCGVQEGPSSWQRETYLPCFICWEQVIREGPKSGLGSLCPDWQVPGTEVSV